MLFILHDDFLRRPETFQEGDRLAFVFDRDVMAYRRYGLKRINFIFEALTDLRAEIYEGNWQDVVAKLASDVGEGDVVSFSSVCPALSRCQRPLVETGVLSLLDEDPFVQLPENTDLKRFSRYWRKAQKTAFVKTADLKALG